MIFKSDNRGMTLVEVIIAMSIFSLVIATVVEIFLVSTRSKNIVFEQLEVQGQARKAVHDFIGEARAMRYSSAGAYPLQNASTTEIIFYTNINADNIVERVRYFYVTNTLKRGTIEPSGNPLVYMTSTEKITTIVNNVTNGVSPVFYYYDEDYTSVSSTPLAQPVDVTKARIIEMRLIIDKNPLLSPVPFAIQGQTAIRNLKTN